MKTILLATDGSKGADEAASAAVKLAAETGAELHVVGVDDSLNRGGLDAVPYETAKAAAVAAKEAGVTATAERRVGPAADQILEAARASEADMIVVGSRGRGWLKGTVFGSVSSALVHRADRPVLVVRSARRLPVTAPDAAALAMTEPDADVAVATAATPAATAAPAAAADADSPGDVMPAAGRPLIAVELPGMSPDDVELEVGGDTLIVRASHTVHGDGDSTVVERVYARFALPRGTRPEDLAATLVDGVLSVALAPATKPRVEVPVATT